MQAAPCLLWEQAPQGHPFPCVEMPPTEAEDLLVVTPRLKDDAGLKAAAVPRVEMAETVAAVRRTIFLL